MFHCLVLSPERCASAVDDLLEEGLLGVECIEGFTPESMIGRMCTLRGREGTQLGSGWLCRGKRGKAGLVSTRMLTSARTLRGIR